MERTALLQPEFGLDNNAEPTIAITSGTSDGYYLADALYTIASEMSDSHFTHYRVGLPNAEDDERIQQDINAMCNLGLSLRSTRGQRLEIPDSTLHKIIDWTRRRDSSTSDSERTLRLYTQKILEDIGREIRDSGDTARIALWERVTSGEEHDYHE